jgi:hypothetical protein
VAMIEELQAEMKAILAAAFFKSQVSMWGEALEVVPSPRRHTSGNALGPCMRFALEHESSRVVDGAVRGVRPRCNK